MRVTRRRRLLAPLVAVALPFLVAAGLAAIAAGRGPIGMDRSLLALVDGFYDVRAAYLTTEALIRGSIAAGALLAAGIFAFLLVRRLRRLALFWALVVAGVLALDPLLKALVKRPGIGNAADEYSFPSGNAMASVAIAAAVFLLLGRSRWRRLALVLGVLAVALEGAGLVALQWHYPSDVIGGWCIALGWVSALWLVLGVPWRVSSAGRPSSSLRSSPSRAGNET
jgi:membrane-associated phospholipid phosphatase